MLLFVPRPEAFADAQADRVCRDYLSSMVIFYFFVHISTPEMYMIDLS